MNPRRIRRAHSPGQPGEDRLGGAPSPVLNRLKTYPKPLTGADQRRGCRPSHSQVEKVLTIFLEACPARPLFLNFFWRPGAGPRLSDGNVLQLSPERNLRRDLGSAPDEPSFRADHLQAGRTRTGQ